MTSTSQKPSKKSSKNPAKNSQPRNLREKTKKTGIMPGSKPNLTTKRRDYSRMNTDNYTITETFIEVGDGHQLYAQEWGNKKAISTVIFLHGGPGGGCSDRAKRQFNPSQHRVIFFDQRGCGRSLPYGSLTHNTTDKLIEDINMVAKHFTLKTFVL